MSERNPDGQISVEQRGRILLMGLDRPEKYNGLTPGMMRDLALAYTRLDGIPMGRHLRPFFAWYGDMEMFSHLWGIVGVGRATVVLEFHKTVSVRDFPSRKALAAHCQAVVAAGVSSAISGRPQPALLPNGGSAGVAPAPGAQPA